MTRSVDHGWTAQQREQAALDAGRVRSELPRSYDEMGEQDIRAEYAAVLEWDAWTARQLEQRFPWLRSR